MTQTKGDTYGLAYYVISTEKNESYASRQAEGVIDMS
jgi:hypothetical protein